MPLSRNLRFPILNAHALPITTTTTTSRRTTAALRPFSHRAPLLATSDYGSGAGDPRGENPQSQGANPSADKEHPGPPPPQAGQGSGSTPTKGTAEGHNVSDSPSAPSSGGGGGSSAQNSGSGAEGGKRQFSTSVRVGKDDALRSKPNQGAEPKILKDAAPEGGESSEEVRKHNEEFERRHDKAHARVTEADAEKERVGKGFWTGEW
ncbi:MAG: hypothetical protein Q9165_002999 [Trypethelium subeluteriae]